MTDQKDRFPLSGDQIEEILAHGYLSRFSHVVVPMPNSFYPEGLLPTGFPGEYSVEATFQVPARVVPDNIDLNFQQGLPGDSLLRLVDPSENPHFGSLRLTIGSLPGDLSSTIYLGRSIDLFPNPRGFLSHAITQIHAQDFLNARKAFDTAVLPALTNLSYLHDVPLDVLRIRIEELSTNAIFVEYLHSFYKRVGFDRSKVSNVQTLSQLYHPLVYYREALGATSPAFQYICYFKSIELARHILATELTKDKKHMQNPKLTGSESVFSQLKPTVQNEIRGKSIKDVTVNILRPHRNTLAHAYTESTSVVAMHPEELVNSDRTYDLLPLARYIARETIDAALAAAQSFTG